MAGGVVFWDTGLILGLELNEEAAVILDGTESGIVS